MQPISILKLFLLYKDFGPTKQIRIIAKKLAASNLAFQAFEGFAKIWISQLKFKFSQILLVDKNATYLCSKIISTLVAPPKWSKIE